MSTFFRLKVIQNVLYYFMNVAQIVLYRLTNHTFCVTIMLQERIGITL